MTARNDTVPTRYWHRLDGGRVQCDLCPRYCKLHKGQRGLCFVRAERGGEIVLTTYGRSSGFCIDPIEKKPLKHFLPGTPVLSFGTAGCNLACKYCQNWDISKSREFDSLADSAEPGKLARVAAELGCRSIAYTYNDPVIFMEYAIDNARACRELGINTVAVTAGYICDAPRRELFSHIDAVNVDLKAFSDEFYHKICAAQLQTVLDTLCYLKNDTDAWLEVTTLLIPGHNDSDDELQRMAAWMAANMGPYVPWHFSAFHPDWKMLNVAATPAATLTRARDIAMRAGMAYVYTGNVRDPEGDSTYCPGCGHKVIGRDWYVLTDWQLDEKGHCRQCGYAVHGIFEAAHGNWGAKRVPVNIGAI